MQIATVQFYPGNSIYQVSLNDGTILWVPQDASNADYVRVQAWTAAGGVVSEA